MSVYGVLFSLLFTLCVQAQDYSDINIPVESYKLSNGLFVVLHKDVTSPIVSHHIWFHVGSKDEEVGYTGIAHLFEHMMFKGTKNVSGKQYEKTLREIGAVNNAFTYFDYTGYYVNAPSSHLEKVMELESDRMENLIIDKTNLDSEREVVKEERRYRVENNVIGLMMEKINNLAYKKSSYRWPVIGYMKDLENISVSKATEFYRQYYAPNNAVLVIAGDIQIAKTKQLIERYYGKLKSQKINRPETLREDLQQLQRRDVFYKEIQNDYLSISFPIPSIRDEKSPAFEIASQILGDGNSSRFYKKFVDELQTATQIFAFTTSTKEAALFTVGLSLKPEKNKNKADNIIKKMERQLFEEIRKLADVKPEELQKVKNKIIKSHVDSLKTIDGRANSLAMNQVVVGSYKALFEDLKKYNAVTLEDLKELVPYFSVEKSNVVIARPEGFKK